MWESFYFLYKSLLPLESFDFRNSFKEVILNQRKCYVFEPTGYHKGIILVVHGMTVKGIDDKRLWKQCDILRQLKYRVYLPYYQELHQLEIKTQTIKKIIKDSEAIFKENNQKIKIMSISFSGGLSLIASTHKSIKDKIDSLLIIGTYANVKTILKFLFTEERIDLYGYYALLKNFINTLPKFKSKKYSKLFELAAKDNALLTTNLTDAYLNKHPELKKIFQDFVENKEFKLKILNQILQLKQMQELSYSLDVLPRVQHLKARISLIHGKNDNVIPPGESLLIVEECKKYHIPYQICLTSLLDHGNVRFDFEVIKEILVLIKTLHFFFKNS